MSRIRSIFRPEKYIHFVEKCLWKRRLRLQPNWLGTKIYPPGHFASPLLDIESLGTSPTSVAYDGLGYWENIDLRAGEQQSYYQDLVQNFPLPPFPGKQSAGFRYYTDNGWFVISDAFTLSGVMRKEKPRRIVEVGSGFSSAVMLDTLSMSQASPEVTFIEPFPERLQSLLSTADKSTTTILVNPVQEVPLSVFDQLEAQDVLFIDSSHVAKVGSDVTFIFLRILPRLKKGVLVHFHDIFFPFSYPMEWIRQGRAWNESLFLRAFLVSNPKFQVIAFNSFAGYSFPEVFRERCAPFLENTGGSIWLRKLF